MNIPLSKYDIDEQMEFRTSSGSSVGIEGAYFFNPYMGIGGRFTVSNTSIVVNTNNAEDDTFDAISLCGGMYFSYPLSLHWLIGSKLLGGYVHYSRLTLADQMISARDGACFGSDFSMTFRAREQYGVKFFLDYNLISLHSKSSNEWINMLTCGVSIAIML